MIAVVLNVGLALAAAGPPAGRWEGVIQYPRRPVVLNADFVAARATADAAGTAALALENVTVEGDRLRFQLALGSDRLMFEGELGPSEIRGTVHAGERQLAFWLKRLPERAPPRDRVEAWTQDLEAMLERFLRYDRSFTEASRAAFIYRIAELAETLAGKTDPEVVVALARAVAISGNAHTRLYLVRNRTEVRRLPVRVWWFADGLYVLRASPEHRDLLGCRVERVGSTDVDAAAARVRGIKAGNASWQRYMSSYLLTSPEILAGAGIGTDLEHVSLRLRCAGGSRDVRLAPFPLQRKTTPTEAWWDLAPTYRAPEGLVGLLPEDRAPRYLRHPDEHYWFERLPELGALYFQFNRSQERPGVPMAPFIDRLGQAIQGQPLRAFIVDLRFNTGGDLTVGTPLVERLAPRLRDVPVFVLTGRSTFSAGITHAVQWKQAARVTVVGEPAGDELDSWSEGGNLVLPNSALTVHYSSGFHAYSKRTYPEHEPYLLDLDVDSLGPDVTVEPTWADYAAGRDPVLEAVAKRLRRR
jgi:hypothetical protein